MMNSDEDDSFLDEMSDVTPLQREPRVGLKPGGADAKDSSLEHRRQAAVQENERDRNMLTQQDIAPLDPWYVLDFKRPGIQNGVFRKLKQGRYEAEAHLDLHRMTVEVARAEIFEFVEACHGLGLRSVMVIHGKGEGRAEKERSSILKAYVEHWLREFEIVQAFHSAQPRHGGTGAVYILLRKSEEKKRESRIKFAKGREPYDPI